MKKLFAAVMAVLVMLSAVPIGFAASYVIGSHGFSTHVSGSQKKFTRTVKTKKDTYKIHGYSFSNEAKKVLSMVNDEREMEGLKPLAWEPELVEPALQRAAEQVIDASHTRPDGSRALSVSAIANGENLAGGDTSAEDVMEGWMNSPGHRENILDKDFTGIAVACIEVEESDYGVYWVQLFHAGTTDLAPKEDAKKPASSTNEADEKKFSLKTLKSGVKLMTAEQKEKKLYDSSIISVSNQIIRLNNEIAAKKKPSGVAEIKATLKELDKLLVKTDVKKLSVYTKANTAKKTGAAAIAETQKRLDKLRKSLDKAMKSYGVKSAASSQAAK